MELLILLIRLIVRGFSPPPARPQSSSNPDEVVRQIQARIEAARLQQPLPQVGGPQGRKTGLNKGQIKAAARQGPPAFRKQKSKKKMMPPALPAKVFAAPVVQAVVAPPVAPKPAKPTVYVDAQVLGRWLRPQTLRSQFILTEIFQPPVALRETHLM